MTTVGEGSIPVRTIHAARAQMTEGLAAGPRRYLVATSSHCHALAGVLVRLGQKHGVPTPVTACVNAVLALEDRRAQEAASA